MYPHSEPRAHTSLASPPSQPESRAAPLLPSEAPHPPSQRPLAPRPHPIHSRGAVGSSQEQVWGIGWLTDEPRQLGEGAGGSDSLSRAGMCPGDRALPRRRGWGPVLPASSAQPLQPGVNGHQCPGGPSPSTDGQRRTLLISQVLGEERGALASQPPHLTCTGPSLTPRTPPVPMPLPAATDEPWRTRADHSLPTLHQ